MADTFSEDLSALRPRLLAFARSLASGPEEAEDLVQETLVRALAARDRYQRGTNLPAWLFTILRNLHLNRRRDAARWGPVVDLEQAGALAVAADDSPESLLVARAEVGRVLAALRRLPPAFAAPLHLVAIEELSYAEVAKVLDIPVGTVMSRIYRARRLMIHWLAEP